MLYKAERISITWESSDDSPHGDYAVPFWVSVAGSDCVETMKVWWSCSGATVYVRNAPIATSNMEDEREVNIGRYLPGLTPGQLVKRAFAFINWDLSQVGWNNAA
jgi:hypothetical protein